LNLLLELYFKPSILDFNLECENCKKNGISKFFKYIYKFPNNIFIGFSNFSHKFNEKEIINSIVFEKSLILNIERYSFFDLKFKNVNKNYETEIGKLNIILNKFFKMNFILFI